MYTFIHPTKSGGTALEQYFDKYYQKNIDISGGHEVKCSNTNNPIIVVRDVKTRFYSMYKYWKNGAIDGLWKRSLDEIQQNKNTSIFDFINILLNNNKKLCGKFIHPYHFYNTCYWIPKNVDYKNLIIIKYDTNLNDKVQKLINILNMESTNIPLNFVNVSNNINTEFDINDERINNFIEKYFYDDIQLIKKINSQPELFKLVI